MADGLQWVAVAVVVFDGRRLLALRRAAGRPGAGLWEAVSGRVQPGEDPREAARREVREETGLEVRLTERPVDAYAAQRGQQPMTVIVFAAGLQGGVLALDAAEHDAHAWLTVDEFAARTTLARLAEAARRAQAAVSA